MFKGNGSKLGGNVATRSQWLSPLGKESEQGPGGGGWGTSSTVFLNPIDELQASCA